MKRIPSVFLWVDVSPPGIAGCCWKITGHKTNRDGEPAIWCCKRVSLSTFAQEVKELLCEWLRISEYLITGHIRKFTSIASVLMQSIIHVLQLLRKRSFCSNSKIQGKLEKQKSVLMVVVPVDYSVLGSLYSPNINEFFGSNTRLSHLPDE